jgi:hypothetical protein
MRRGARVRSGRSSPGSRLRPSPRSSVPSTGRDRFRGRNRTQTLGAVRARMARRRPRRRHRLRQACVRERQAQANQVEAQQPRCTTPGKGARGAKPATGLRKRDPVPERTRRADRLPKLRPTALEARPSKPQASNHRAISTSCATLTPPSRCAPVLRSSPFRASWARASR